MPRGARGSHVESSTTRCSATDEEHRPGWVKPGLSSFKPPGRRRAGGAGLGGGATVARPAAARTTGAYGGGCRRSSPWGAFRVNRCRWTRYGTSGTSCPGPGSPPEALMYGATGAVGDGAPGTTDPVRHAFGPTRPRDTLTAGDGPIALRRPADPVVSEERVGRLGLDVEGAAGAQARAAGRVATARETGRNPLLPRREASCRRRPSCRCGRSCGCRGSCRRPAWWSSHRPR